MPNKMVPDGFNGWALVRKKPFEVLEMFQSQDLANQAAQSLGGDGYEVRHGRIEKGTGIFLTPDLERQR